MSDLSFLQAVVPQKEMKKKFEQTHYQDDGYLNYILDELQNTHIQNHDDQCWLILILLSVAAILLLLLQTSRLRPTSQLRLISHLGPRNNKLLFIRHATRMQP